MAGKRTMGTRIKLRGEGSEEDLLLSNTASIGEVSTDTDEIDVTTLDSPNGAKEYIQGAKDSGDFDVELNNVFDGVIETLNSIFDSGETRSWVVEFVDSDLTTVLGTLDLDAFVKTRAYGEVTTDGLHKATFTLRVTGSPVYEEGSSS